MQHRLRHKLATGLLVAGFLAVTGTTLFAHETVLTAEIVCVETRLIIQYTASSLIEGQSHPQVEIRVNSTLVDTGAYAAPDWEFSGTAPLPPGSVPGDVITVTATAVGPWSDGFAGGQVASVDVVVPEGCTPPVIGGCTIGFWKNHQSVWPGDYDPSDSFDALVGVADAFPGKTLLQVLNLSGTPLNNLGKQFVAALLNAESGIYPLSVQEVKDLFNDNYNTGDAEALKDLFDQYNNGGCAID